MHFLCVFIFVLIIKAEVLANTSDAKYIIYKNEDTIYAENGSTGAIEFSGTDASTVIQTSIDALTNGRSWKEKVIIKGEFDISQYINIPSYTMIEVMGKLTVVGNRNVSRIFDINGSTDTEITGGVLDGNDTTQSVWNNGILVTNATMTTIHDIHIKNFRNECIEFKESADFIIRNVTAENSGDDCFSIIYNSHNGVIEGNLCKNA